MSEILESDVEEDSVTSTRIISSLFVTFLGVIFMTIHLLHLIDEDGLIPLLTGVVFPSAFAVFLIYAGYRLFKSNLTDSERLGVVSWTVVGGVGIGSFFIAAVVYNMYEGGSMRHPVFLLINSLNVGAAVGFTVGWYYSKESHQISLLQNERLELSKQRRKLEEAQEMAHVGHWEWNPDTGEMEWSDEMFRILGLTPDEIEPKYDDFVEFVYPDDTKKVKTAMEKSVESHTFDIDYRVIRSDGDIRVVHQKVDVYDYGYGDEEDSVSGGDYDGRENSPRVFGTVNDVTHERKIDHLLNSIRSISQIVIEAEREEEVFNSSLEILSARSDQGYGFGCASIATFKSKDTGTEVDSIYTANRIGETEKESEERWREVYTEEYIDEVLDEGTLTIDDVTQPPYEHHDEDSLSHGAIGVSLRHRDNFYGVMTLHIPSPSQISEEERHLIDEIASNISRGIYALRAEERIENERDELALLNRIVRHDIRNDMNLVLGWGDMLRDHVDDEGEEYLETVLSTSEHVVDLTKTARDFVDAIEKEEEIDLRPVSLTSVLKETVESRRQTYDEAEFESGEIPKVEVRANDLLSTVFRNLLNNAVQHNDKETPRVEVSAEEKDVEVVVSVADNGLGVPDTQKESIFGRGEKGLESEGTGIGLYLVDTLVDEYGGDVWVEDNEPEGSVFKIKLPKW
ncbi:ATP-binding protein [Halorutilales archaeon Cl-col2-1]